MLISYNPKIKYRLEWWKTIALTNTEGFSASYQLIPRQSYEYTNQNDPLAIAILEGIKDIGCDYVVLEISEKLVDRNE